MSSRCSGQAAGKGRWGPGGEQGQGEAQARAGAPPRRTAARAGFVASALGDVVQVSALSHEPNTRAWLRSHGSRSSQGNVEQVWLILVLEDEPVGNLSCQLVAASLLSSKLLKNLSAACPNGNTQRGKS